MEGERSFGPYRLLRRVAVGGMAEIYLAQARGFGGFEKLIALKMIHQNYSLDEHFVQMLIDEAKISVQLQHVNIGQIFDLGRIGETYYITMEFIDGADLFKVLRRASELDRDMPIEVAAFIAQEVCAGLDYAHEKCDDEGRPLKVIHRDISPQNILVSSAGEVKIVDFGIAKAALRARQTAAGVIKGKYYYMSPEQAWGDPVDPRTDIFSTGILLYEMLTGQMLYLEDDLHRLLDRVRRADIAPPSTRRRDIPPELEQICMRALRKRPEDRWQAAHDFQAALQKFLFAFAPDFTRGRLAAFVRDVLQEEAPPPAAPAPPPAATGERLAPDEHSVIFRLQDLAAAVRHRPQARPQPAITGGLEDNGDTALTTLPPLGAFESAEVTNPRLATPEQGTPVTALHEKRTTPGPASDFADEGDPTIIDSGVRRFGPRPAAAPKSPARPRLPGIPDDTELNEEPDATVAARPRPQRTPAPARSAARPQPSRPTPAAGAAAPARPPVRAATPARAAAPARPAPRGEAAARPRPAAARPPAAPPQDGGQRPRRGGELEDIMELMGSSRVAAPQARAATPPPAAPVRTPPRPEAPRAAPPVRPVASPFVDAPGDRTDPTALTSVEAPLELPPPRALAGPSLGAAAAALSPPPPLAPGGVVVPPTLLAAHEPTGGAELAVPPPGRIDAAAAGAPAHPPPFVFDLDGAAADLAPRRPPVESFDLGPGGIPGLPGAAPAPPAPLRRPGRALVFALGGIAASAVAAAVAVLWLQRAPAVGVVEVASVPSGAQVQFDDTSGERSTPVSIRAVDRRAPHRVRVTLPGYEPWEGTVSFERSQESLQLIAVLTPIVGVVSIETDPPGAQVALDGRPQGATPRRIDGLPVQSPVRVRVQLPGYRTVEQTAEWGGRKEIQLKLKLERDEPLAPRRGKKR